MALLIISLLQKGQVKMIDNLTYNIVGNRLSSVTDAGNNLAGYEGGGGAIGYDANGNMTSMADKGISAIAYNFLNLPEQITQTNVTKYYYRADGVKTKKAFTLNNALGNTTTTTEYLDGFVYTTGDDVVQAAFRETDSSTLKAATAGEEEAFVSGEERAVPQQSGMVLAYFPTAEGYYDYTNNRYIYQYKDHLGNVRLSYTKNSAGALTILDRNDYYAFGMNFYGYSSVYDATGTPLNNKYNQKELQETGFYDYGWRQYMPDLGRWFGMDQLSEKFHGTSPYAYAVNNPVMFYDIDGRDLPDWAQNMWDNTTTHSSWSSNGNGGFTGGEVKGGMSSQQVTSFINFAMGGGTGNFRYWTGGSNTYSGYVSNGEAHISGDLGIMHEIKIKGHDDNSFGDFLGDAGNINDFYDSMGGSLASNAGNTRIGTNGRIYFPNTNGRVFFGNQYVRTLSWAEYGSKIGKIAGPLGYVINGAKIANGMSQDGWKYGKNAEVATAGAAGGMAGAWMGAEAGAWAGMKAGAAVGVWVEGWGAAPGAAIGGIVGGLIGSFAGGYYGGNYAEQKAEGWLK
ncbi:MAG: hypothetical protein L6262_04905 [Weeksellaceae bacterium]|nr:hypothetical protein [Weeksellaceae bacterium]